MKKISKILMALFISIFFVGCFASNTDINPKKVLVREFKGLKVEIARSDLSGIFLDVQNRTNQKVSILWDKTTLGDSPIVRHDGIINTAINSEETELKELERASYVLHRKVDFYYLDPVLYAKGGLRIKPLKYPVELKLMTKMNGVEELVTLYIDNNYTSTEDANSDRYQEDRYVEEKKEMEKRVANDEDIKYTEKYLRQYKNENRRTKGDTIPKLVPPYNDNPPVEDTLIIEHKTK